jgi:hypothetical protein
MEEMRMSKFNKHQTPVSQIIVKPNYCQLVSNCTLPLISCKNLRQHDVEKLYKAADLQVSRLLEPGTVCRTYFCGAQSE